MLLIEIKVYLNMISNMNDIFNLFNIILYCIVVVVFTMTKFRRTSQIRRKVSGLLQLLHIFQKIYFLICDTNKISLFSTINNIYLYAHIDLATTNH